MKQGKPRIRGYAHAEIPQTASFALNAVQKSLSLKTRGFVRAAIPQQANSALTAVLKLLHRNGSAPIAELKTRQMPNSAQTVERRILKNG